MYWSIGKDIVEKKAEDVIGGNFYKRISSDLQSEFPDMKGFSERNIFYMRSMFLLFSPLETELPQAVAVNVKEILCAENIGKRLEQSRIDEHDGYAPL